MLWELFVVRWESKCLNTLFSSLFEEITMHLSFLGMEIESRE